MFQTSMHSKYFLKLPGVIICRQEVEFLRYLNWFKIWPKRIIYREFFQLCIANNDDLVVNLNFLLIPYWILSCWMIHLKKIFVGISPFIRLCDNVQVSSHLWIQGYFRKAFCWFSWEVFELKTNAIPIFASSFQELLHEPIRFLLWPTQ